jgi:hypothetical protein
MVMRLLNKAKQARTDPLRTRSARAYSGSEAATRRSTLRLLVSDNLGDEVVSRQRDRSPLNESQGPGDGALGVAGLSCPTAASGVAA